MFTILMIIAVTSFTSFQAILFLSFQSEIKAERQLDKTLRHSKSLASGAKSRIQMVFYKNASGL